MKNSFGRSLLQAAGLVALLSTDAACRPHTSESMVRLDTRNALAPIFPDVLALHQNFPAIQFVGRYRIMRAFADGRFHPSDGMPRGEALRTFLDTAGVNDIPTPSSDPFPDVSASHPLAGYLLRASQLGIVRGYEAGDFRIDRIVSLIEAIKMLLLTFRIPAEQLHNLQSYTDVPMGVWYVPFARYAMEHRLIVTQPDGSMGRDRQLTRAEIADLLYRFFQGRPDLLTAFVNSLANH